MSRENIHINVYDQNKHDINSSENSSEKYIILMNEELNNKNTDYLIKIEELESNIETLENDFDREEKKTIYMRGLLKNIFHLNTIEKSLNKEYQNVLNKNINKLEDLINFIKTFPIIFLMLLFPLFMIDYSIIDITMIIILYITTFFVSYYLITKRIYDKSIYQIDTKFVNINLIKNDIKKLEKNNDNINEFIDCI